MSNYRIIDFGTSRGVMLHTSADEGYLSFMAWRAWQREDASGKTTWELDGQRTDETAEQCAERQRLDNDCSCYGEVGWDGCSQVWFNQEHACHRDEWTKLGLMFDAIFDEAERTVIKP